MSTMNRIIKEKRTALGITQKELADKLSISDKTVSRWESGNQVPDAILLPDLAEALNISISELYGIKTEPKQNSAEPCLHTPPSKFSSALNTAYKIIMALGLIIFIFGAMVLIHINTIRGFSPENGQRDYGNIFTYIGVILCISAQISYMIIRRKKLLSAPLHIKSEIIYGSVCSLSILAVFLIVFPVCITVPITYSYEFAVALFATGTLVMMFFQKQKLRKEGIKVGKSVEIISASLLLLCVIIFIGVWVYFTFVYKVEINKTESREEALINLLYEISGLSEIENKTIKYSFLASALPLFLAPFINFIHLLIKAKNLK